MIDFTNSRILPGKAYNGANGSKIAVEYEGKAYMLKFPPSGDGKPTELSYTNSCISEHLASSIFNRIGIKAQETMLGTYTVKGKVKTVCACRDFTADGKRLFDFCSIKIPSLIPIQEEAVRSWKTSWIRLISSSLCPPCFYGSISGMFLLRMHCSAILTGIMATGDFI